MPVEGKKCTDPLVTGTNPWTGLWTTPVPTTEAPLDPPPKFWPKGKYGMVMAGAMCPRYYSDTKPNFRWKSGFVYQDTEDFRNGNNWDPVDHPALAPMMKSDGINLLFCIKVSDRLSGKKDKHYNFPRGNYCIHRQGSKCPKGPWKSGRITHDDENTNNRNSNSGPKSRPAGLFNQDKTSYDYCCRDDGDVDTPILLPATTPFYMYQYTVNKCQKVGHMTETEHKVQWDDEDTDNKNSKDTVGVPYNTGDPTNHRLHMCHYEPGAYKETTKGGNKG